MSYHPAQTKCVPQRAPRHTMAKALLTHKTIEALTLIKLLAMRKFGSALLSEPATGENRAPEGLEEEVWTYPQFFRLLRKEVGRSRTGDRTFSFLMFEIDDVNRHFEMDGEEGVSRRTWRPNSGS